MIAGRLTMRAAIERNQATGQDAWGQAAAADFQAIAEPLACFVWSEAANIIEDGRKTAEVERFRALFALDADLRADDEIASITDRAGAEIIAGRLKVDGPIQRKHTHLECALERIG